MKRVIVSSLMLALLVGCSSLATKSPTAVERMLYDTHTNYVDVYKVITNYQAVTFTNILDQVVTTTNPVVAMVTNVVAEYTITPKATVVATVGAAGTATNVFYPGIGTIASTGIVALLGLWAWFRGRSNTTAANNATVTLAQEIETIKEFILTLPKGAAYGQAITNWLQTHQVQTGVASQVVSILQSEVSNPDALAALKDIQTAITTAGTVFVPAPVVGAATVPTAATGLEAIPTVPAAKPPVSV